MSDPTNPPRGSYGSGIHWPTLIAALIGSALGTIAYRWVSG